MRRDVLATRTHEDHVTGNNTTTKSNTTSTTSENLSPAQSAAKITEDFGINNNEIVNSTGLTGRSFYTTYDPEVGIDIASVLGGILLFLVVYVIYRTKCRKRILKAFQQCSMKYFPEEFPPQEDIPYEPPGGNFKAGDSEWISESAKMIWQERAKLSREPETNKCFLTDHRSCVNGHLDNCEDFEQVIDVDIDRNANDISLQLPEVEENIEQATAQWVQSCKEMDPKEKQLNGIILKIPPELVSHAAKVRSHFHSVTDYGDINEFVNISERNKSLPLLIEQQSFVFSKYASAKPRSSKKRQNCVSVSYAPLATQEELDLDIGPYQPHVQHQSGSKVPLDICPIVRVQHYHSRSKRRLTSLCRTSSEESSSSSDDQNLIEHVGQLAKTVGQAKYIRLQTDDIDKCQQSDTESFQKHNNKVPNNLPKYFPAGNLETSL